MTYVLLGLILVALIAIGAAIIMGQMLKASKLQVKELEGKIAASELAVKTTKAECAETIGRTEKLITKLKSDIESLEKALAEASTPAAVGERFDKLFP